jgi:hypothetical protein
MSGLVGYMVSPIIASSTEIEGIRGVERWTHATVSVLDEFIVIVRFREWWMRRQAGKGRKALVDVSD